MNGDPQISVALSQYTDSKADWNVKIYSYEALLKHYYGHSTDSIFIQEIYNHLVLLGQDVEDNKFDSTFINEFEELRKKNINFIRGLYELADK
jgi:hypothetical protein